MGTRADSRSWEISRGVSLVPALLKQGVRENHGESLNTRAQLKKEKEEAYAK
jgi:hypothetical protein